MICFYLLYVKPNANVVKITLIAKKEGLSDNMLNSPTAVPLQRVLTINVHALHRDLVSRHTHLGW